jgi:hypothetical protein
MKPIYFKGANCNYAESQEEYLTLPAYKHEDEDRTVSSCWKLSIMERIKVLFTGKVYLSLLSFGEPLTPQLLQVDSPVDTNKDNLRHLLPGEDRA